MQTTQIIRLVLAALLAPPGEARERGICKVINQLTRELKQQESTANKQSSIWLGKGDTSCN